MGGSAGAGLGSPGGHLMVGARALRSLGDRYDYGPNWIAEMKKTIEDELRERGLEPTPVVLGDIMLSELAPSKVGVTVAWLCFVAYVATMFAVLIWESIPD